MNDTKPGLVGYYACFSLYGEHHAVVLPANDESFENGVPSSSQWFATREDAVKFLENNA